MTMSLTPSMRYARSGPRVVAETVVDASALVDLLLGDALGDAVGDRLSGRSLHAPAHIDGEVLSALGRLHRAGDLGPDAVEAMLAALAVAPIQRHQLSELLIGAWGRRHQLRLADALYVELAASRELPLVTTDSRLHDVPVADVVSP